MKQLFFFQALCVLSINLAAQKIFPQTDDFKALIGQRSVEALVKFDGMTVDQFEDEQRFLDDMRQRFDKKKPGDGDRWVSSWMEKKILTFDRRCKDLFFKYSDLDRDETAKYILIFKTTRIETGFNAPVGQPYAFVSGRLIMVCREEPATILAMTNIITMKGEAVIADLTGSVRIGDAFGRLGRAFGNYIKDVQKGK